MPFGSNGSHATTNIPGVYNDIAGDQSTTVVNIYFYGAIGGMTIHYYS